MVNVTVLKIKDLIKYAVYLITIILFIVIIFNLTIQKQAKTTEETETKSEVSKILESEKTKILEKQLPFVFNNSEETKDVANQSGSSIITAYMEEIIKGQIGTIRSMENPRQTENQEIDKTTSENLDTNQQTEEQTNKETQVVTQNPIAENYNVEYGNVKIKNQTDYELTEEMLTPDITIENKNIIIFHTHTCESYTTSEKFPYEQTSSFRTTDLNFTVARVGTELENYLKGYNYNVIHDTTYHDYPSYTGSYTRSEETVTNILKTNPSDIIIDLHRDAVGSRGDYAPTVKIGEDYAAQIMFVIGTNNGGLWHPNWNNNLKFAIKIQQKAEELYPGLFKPIMLTKSRYNQHTGKYANIIEVGATGNTLEQCLTSMKYLAEIMK